MPFYSHTDMATLLQRTESGNVYVFPRQVATCVERGEDGEFHLSYHGTRLITYHPDNTFSLFTGGLHTKTTIQRLTEYGPVRVFRQKHCLYIEAPEGSVEFFDGIRVDSFGEPVGPDPEPEDEYAVEMTVDNQINKTYL